MARQVYFSFHYEDIWRANVAGKPGGDVPAGTLANILRQAGLRGPRR